MQGSVTSALVDAASEGLAAFVYTSGASVYGASATPATEDTPLDPCRIAEPYAAGERLVLRGATERGLPAMVLRPGAAYGFGGVFGRFWAGPMAAGKRVGIPGDGHQRFSFIHIDDCARAFVHAVEHPLPGEACNVADDEPVALGDMIRATAQALGAPRPFNIPAPLFKAVAGGIVGELLLRDKTASNHKMTEQLGVQLRYPTHRDGVAALTLDTKSAPA